MDDAQGEVKRQESKIVPQFTTINKLFFHEKAAGFDSGNDVKTTMWVRIDTKWQMSDNFTAVEDATQRQHSKKGSHSHSLYACFFDSHKIQCLPNNSKRCLIEEALCIRDFLCCDKCSWRFWEITHAGVTHCHREGDGERK